METGVPYALNTACRKQDMTKVRTLGPLACAISLMIQGTEGTYRRQDPERLPDDQDTLLYRGFKLPEADLDEWRVMEKQRIQISGMVSTSKDPHKALEYAFRNVGDRTPIVQVIKWRSRHHVRLGGPEWSAYPDEDEVLLMDGQKFILESLERRPMELRGKSREGVYMELRYDGGRDNRAAEGTD